MEQEHICRICMQGGVLVNWNKPLSDAMDISYKDCYYKYTRLEEMDFVSDALPQFFCQLCSIKMKRFHLLIEKAIETQKYLEQKLQESLSLPVVKNEIEEETECVYMPDICFEITAIDSLEETPESELPSQEEEEANSTEEDSRNELSETQTGNLTENEYDLESNGENGDGENESMISVEEKKNNRSKLETRKGAMCSYCSKILQDAYALRMHELIHKEDREREVTCSICGLKTFTKRSLYTHMKIHDKNREKEFKCEFCDKAFFHRGACNVHRRIHLGQMIKCPICPKEFARQVDVDRHVQSHSSTPLHAAKPKPKLKYIVHCKDCNKDINSANFNAHRARHLNEPFVRCILCEKDFFSRAKCTIHMKRVHKRTKDNYDDITMYYEKYRPRLSHVLMKQQEDVEAKT